MLPAYFDMAFNSFPETGNGKEYLITSVQGHYASADISGCNTRKYHGLLVAPQPNVDNDNHVLLSSIDEVITCEGYSYALATHFYPNAVHPQGFNHIKGFYATPIPKWVYQVDGIVFTKEMLFSDEGTLLVCYTVEQARKSIELSLTPLLAFRNQHQLSKANNRIHKKTIAIPNGIKLRPYDTYTPLHLQVSAKASFINAPDWYYHLQYPIERERGYPYQEDLFAPGHFKLSLKEGEQVIIAAGLHEVNPRGLKNKFRMLLERNLLLTNQKEGLEHAAKQFICKTNGKTAIKAGFPWFGAWGRDTFISLPGLTLALGDVKTFKEVIDTALPDLKHGLFPNVGSGKHASYNSADASLWFVWAIQQYASYTKSFAKTWKEYGKPLQSILKHYAKGTINGIGMGKDYLVHAEAKGLALTWMDCVVDGIAVTPRAGKPVEINALWYNAVCFCLELAQAAGDNKFVSQWLEYPTKIRTAFIQNFMEDGKPYLADCVNGMDKDWSIRPNQIFAISLPYSPVPQYLKPLILDTVKNELLTPRGLRTLSPKDPAYQGLYTGNQETRDRAYHQGTVWPWLMGHFAEAYLKEYPVAGLEFVDACYRGFAPALHELCLYSIAEIYDGDEPHAAKGAISQAWSVAELLRMNQLIETYKAKITNEAEVVAV